MEKEEGFFKMFSDEKCPKCLVKCFVSKGMHKRIKSKKLISETLSKFPVKEKDVVNVPISSMLSMANKTISKHIEELNESDKKELNQLLSVDDTELEPKYSTIKESVVERLNTMYIQNHDHSTRKAINETIIKFTRKFTNFTKRMAQQR